MSSPAAAIFLAAGSGRRMGGAVSDKVLAEVGGRAAIEYALCAFRDAGIVQTYVFAYRDPAQAKALEACARKVLGKGASIHLVEGGAERQDSVCSALERLPKAVRYVYIHDAARPLITPEALKLLQAALFREGAAVMAHRVVDTIKRTAAGAGGQATSLEDLERARLWAVETPQAFCRSDILEAYTKVRQAALQVTDDSAALAHLGRSVALVENPQPNLKLTTPQDFTMVEALLAARS